MQSKDEVVNDVGSRIDKGITRVAIEGERW